MEEAAAEEAEVEVQLLLYSGADRMEEVER